VLRALSGADVFVEDRLFATLDATTRAVELGEGYEALVTDAVGCIRQRPHHLVASFRATLEEAQDADLLLHTIDLSHPGWEEQKEVVDEVLAGLGLAERRTVLVFNKVDRLTHGEEEAWGQRARAMFPNASVFVTTVEPGGIEPLRALLREEVRRANPEVRVVLPVTQGALLAEIYREGEVLGREDEDGQVVIRARLPAPVLGRLRQQAGIEVRDGR